MPTGTQVDTEKTRGPISQGRDILQGLATSVTKGDGQGLDPTTAQDLTDAAERTAGVMKTADDKAGTGQEAFDKFDRDAEEAAHKIKADGDEGTSEMDKENKDKSPTEGTRPVGGDESESTSGTEDTAGEAKDPKSEGFSGIPGLDDGHDKPASPAPAGGDVFKPTPNPAFDPDVRAAQAQAMDEARAQQDAQQRQAQQLAAQQAQLDYQNQHSADMEQQQQQAAQARAQQLAASQQAAGLHDSVANTQSWSNAMNDQETRSAMNSMSAAGQDAAMNAVTNHMADNGGKELSEEEIRTIINDMVDDIMAEDDGDESMTDSIDSAHGDGGSLDAAQPDGMSEGDVSFEKTTSGTMSKEEIRDYILDAADLNGIPDDPQVRQLWVNVMSAQCMAESGGDPNAGNGWDSNAVGATQSDGLPAQSSRGAWQTIPGTFAAHHIEGTSNSIYDPQASAAAAMHYMMERYNISPDGQGLEEFAASRGIDTSSGELKGGYVGY